MLLQNDCRISLSEIGRQVDLSVDSVKKRIIKLKKNKIFFPKIQLRPRHFGYPQTVFILLRLKDYSSNQITGFLDYLTSHPRVSEFFSISGEWDYALVLLVKNHEDLSLVVDEIRGEFKDLISGWSELLTKIVYKFENYDLDTLYNYEKKNENRKVISMKKGD